MPHRTPISSHHVLDAAGRPSGGVTQGRGFTIAWQNGPLGRGPDRREPNGAFVEDVIDAARDRLQFYQASPFACAENDEAIQHLERAMDWLGRRTARREARGVEGTHTP